MAVASGLVQQIDVAVFLGAGEAAVDGSRLVALYRIRHFASGDHALALTAVQLGRVTQAALAALWPSVEAEEVPPRHGQLYGAHAPQIPDCARIKTLLVSPVLPILWFVRDRNGPVLAGEQPVETRRETRRSGFALTTTIIAV
jgi:hypothetical protein